MNHRQTQLLQIDAIGLLAETLGDTWGVIIDGGANVGETTAGLRQRFPHAHIHAFEPVGEAFDQLRTRAEELGGAVAAHRLAIGEYDGEADIRVNQNLWTCSLLPASERGLTYHGDWCETVRTERVRVTRIDTWARSHGVDTIELLKLDLQGVEAAALRGAGDLLRRTKAVYAEAQLIPEYEGASTFAEIDQVLRNAGLGFYQMTDLCLKGAHAEPSCCDGIWLRQDLLDEVRRRPTPRVLTQTVDDRPTRLLDALTMCRDAGWRRVAIYGAGAHTKAAGAVLADAPVNIVAIVDDGAGERMSLWGIPIVTRRQAEDLALDAVVISSDRAEGAMLDRAESLLEAGLTVISLYEGGGVCAHAPREHAHA